MHRILTCSLKQWWVKPVFSSRECSSIPAPACLLVVQLSSVEQSCLHHCSLAKHRSIFPLLGFAVQGLHLCTQCCLQCLHPLLSLCAWYTRHFPGNTTCTGIAVAVLLWEGDVTLWTFGPLLSWLSLSQSLGFWVPQLINRDCALQLSLKALQVKGEKKWNIDIITLQNGVIAVKWPVKLSKSCMRNRKHNHRMDDVEKRLEITLSIPSAQAVTYVGVTRGFESGWVLNICRDRDSIPSSSIWPSSWLKFLVFRWNFIPLF